MIKQSAAILSLIVAVSACQNSNDTTKAKPASTVTSASNPIVPALSASADSARGSAGLKGPFKKGSPVRGINVNNPREVVSTTVHDDNGAFSLSVPWEGPTFVEIRGSFVDEFTGALTTIDEPLSAVTNAEAGKALDCSLNILTTISALMVKDTLRTSTSQGVTNPDSIRITAAQIDFANNLVAQTILGSTSDVDISKIHLGDRADKNAAKSLNFQLAVAATVGMGNVVTAAAQFAKEITEHRALGTTANGVVNMVELKNTSSKLEAGDDIVVKTTSGERVRVSTPDILKRIPEAAAR